MRALVSGACGFAGSFLIPHLLEQGDQVVGTFISEESIDRSPLAQLRFEKVVLDITNPAACLELVERVEPEVLYHLAGISFVPEAEANFQKALAINVGGTSNMLRSCSIVDKSVRALVVSSAEVYGRIEAGELPLNENAPLRPQNNYSLTKAMAEMVAQRYSRYSAVDVITVRPFNHIGPGQNERFVTSNFALQLVCIARGRAKPSIQVGNLEARRDFSDVRDVVRAYRLAALQGSGVYVLGSGCSIRIAEVLETLIEISGQKVEIQTDQERVRPLEVPEVYGSIAKARAELDWEPRYKIRDTLQDIYRYWWERVK
jgi:GDP-4-dehydro-6-deoxy-D-mannose reductase